ncbi:hypothetical protein PVL29_001560 [Vitis rotundifolia]|uniref:Uncharacterized protein n=1 Tax=Vitis rotundifolia TaxID=103349 RepID=A0AA39AGL4_VITRO|nr:hypothetical protein PVL29_001560 [Vitis rotundifolia]
MGKVHQHQCVHQNQDMIRQRRQRNERLLFCRARDALRSPLLGSSLPLRGKKEKEGKLKKGERENLFHCFRLCRHFPPSLTTTDTPFQITLPRFADPEHPMISNHIGVNAYGDNAKSYGVVLHTHLQRYNEDLVLFSLSWEDKALQTAT